MSFIEAQTAPAITYYIERVKRKLATGTYATESVACFCGDDQGQAVRSIDRYGLPHRMCFCSRCGLLYASPRMTEDALKQFYLDDYRPIYDAGISDEEFRVLAEDRQASGRALHQLVAQYGLTPTVVMELGCNEGDMLLPFVEEGAACLGVDWDTRAIGKGQVRGLPVMTGGLDELEQYGQRADLIILNHVLEHLTDLEGTLQRLHRLLTPNGLLFIGVPTLFRDQLDGLFQNAHLYQFTARTLAYVMECCGFTDAYLSEDIASLWRPVAERTDKSDTNSAEVYRIAQFLSGKRAMMPMIRTVNKFPRAQRLAQLREAASYRFPNMDPLIGRHQGLQAVVIGGGPSIDGEVERIQALKADGYLVYAIERMLPWCLRHSLMPDYVVAMDAHEDVSEAFRAVPTEPTYLLAMQCHRRAFERLRGHSVYTFSTPQKDIQQADLWEELGVKAWTLVNAGSSVTTCAMSLAMTMGCRRLHVFGFDCQFTDRPYADGIAGVGEIAEVIEIEIDGYAPRVFTTTVPYLAFAQQAIQLIELSRRQGFLDTATIYGDSLIKYLAQPGPKLSIQHRDETCCTLQ